MASAVKNKILDDSSYNVYLTKHTLLALSYVLSLSLSLCLSLPLSGINAPDLNWSILFHRVARNLKKRYSRENANRTKSKGHTKGYFYFYGGRFCHYVSTFMFVASMASAV